MQRVVRISRLFLSFLACSGLLACSGDAEKESTQPSLAGEPFLEGAATVGLDFVHENGMSGELFFPEVMGAGGAWVDVDNDGDLDVFLLQGHVLPTEVAVGPSDRLYRNDLEVDSGGVRRPRFVDITEASGLHGQSYGMGVAVGDVNNDGWPDLYTTAFGENRLWVHGGTAEVVFEDQTASSGTGDSGWGTSAAFVDLDRDGWLDLYLVNYVEYSLSDDVDCQAPSGRPDYCSPNSYTGAVDRLFRNLGVDASGRVRFEDVSQSSGISAVRSNGLGVTVLDMDGDGWLDLYVANDMEPNFLWHNRSQQGEILLQDEGLLSGSALDRSGQAQASMGVVAGDLDLDGDEDLFMTHLDGETNTFYSNDGQGFFEDRTSASGLGSGSLARTGFGTVLVDFDRDGLEDVLVVNGAVTRIEELVDSGDPHPLHQPNQLLRNRGDGFDDVTSRSGVVFELSEVSRGAAVGDVDNDGDQDVLITNNGGPVRLLLGQTPTVAKRWLGLRLLNASGREALGALVILRRGEDAPPLIRRVRTDSSYCSGNDPRVFFGLGEGGLGIPATEVEVSWPEGSRERFAGLKPGEYHTLREGSGKTLPGNR